MRNQNSTRQLCLVVCCCLFGIAGGVLMPLESHAQQEVVFHPGHHCPTITCGHVSASTCVGGGWCNDALSANQFPKCMPNPPTSCEESFGFGRTNCDLGTCVVGGAPCKYSLRHCIQ